MTTINITKDNLHISESWRVKTHQGMQDWLAIAQTQMPSSEVFKRSNFSLLSEWRAHNLLYDLEYKRERTADVDLDIYETTWRKIGYAILGSIYYLFHF